MKFSHEYKEYFEGLGLKLADVLEVAKAARGRLLDPKPWPEPRLTEDMAERVELLVGPPGVKERIRQLAEKMERDEMAFKIAEEIVYGAFGSADEVKLAEQAIRTALAIITEGVTVAPIQGITKIAFKENLDRSKYLSIYFAGPIRPAGGTAQALILVVADFIRNKLGLARYRPTPQEIRRFIEEIRLYEREVRLFQYHVPDEVLERILENIPVEVTGVETDPFEVTSFRNLPRIETNRVRGGALIVVNDGLAGRSRKLMKIITKLGIQGWQWLEYVWSESKGKGQSEPANSMYMEKIIGGRPVLSSPGGVGGFRLRYGRARNTGLAALGVHPSTMLVLGGFLAIGTQLKTEEPGKGGIVASVDTIEPPIVKLRNGSVRRLEDPEEARRLEKEVESVLFLGDLLLSFYEFLHNNRPLAPSGLTEETFRNYLQAAIQEEFEGSLEKASEATGVKIERLRSFLEAPLKYKPKASEALSLSERLKVPIHPLYTYDWERASPYDLLKLREWLSSKAEDPWDGKGEEGSKGKGEWEWEGKGEGEDRPKTRLTLDLEAKEILEKILVPHEVEGKEVILGEDYLVLRRCLGLWEGKGSKELKGIEEISRKGVWKALEELSGLKLEPKYVTFIGAKMGRPEKAKPRVMKPLVHVLFPVGLKGGPLRNLRDAANDILSVEIVRRICPKCGQETYLTLCPLCHEATSIEFSCPRCGRSLKDGDLCPTCQLQARGWRLQSINLEEALRKASANLKLQIPELIKGVRGLSNRNKIPEPLEKGLLRARYGLSVFKDGTVRFDVTNAPLTHFTPSEIGMNLGKLKELGYGFDAEGKPLEREDQVLELKVQDVIIPWDCAQYLLKAAVFIDDLLERFYGAPRFYNAKDPMDLIGHLVLGLAPHTSVAVVGRIIGFTKARVCFAHPYWHAAKRRDCDGDEDSIMLALDAFLNFSVEYLPAQVGGLMDAPLLVSPTINPKEVDSAVQDLDISKAYPSIFYERSLMREDPKKLANHIELIAHRLGKESQFEGFGYTHETSCVTLGNLQSSYKEAKSMEEKISLQLSLAEKIRAVDAKEMVELLLTSHFIPDIAGNLKTFGSQRFRCKKCNQTFRRVPLRGRCPRCGGELTITVHRGSVEKYMSLALGLAEKYELKPYIKQRLTMMKEEIDAFFGERASEREGAQTSLGQFMQIGRE
ncbi:MAG: DNA polymerase II large subunit [Candidatus Bathyarchaeia archaeon]